MALLHVFVVVCVWRREGPGNPIEIIYYQLRKSKIKPRKKHVSTGLSNSIAEYELYITSNGLARAVHSKTTAINMQTPHSK
jgi:hypothetical protein